MILVTYPLYSEHFDAIGIVVFGFVADECDCNVAVLLGTLGGPIAMSFEYFALL